MALPARSRSPQPAPQADEYTTLTTELKRQKVHRRTRARLRVILILVLLTGAFWGTRSRRPKAALPVTEATLAGTWELVTLNNHTIGPNGRTAILGQQVTFRNGSVEGITRLRPGTRAATIELPFPDHSVRRVETADMNEAVVVLWRGEYVVEARGRVALTCGNAKYSTHATLAGRIGTLAFEHDPILVYQGKALYRAVISPPVVSVPAPH